MSEAFLEGIPNKISHPGTSLKGGATPTVAYLTIRPLPVSR